MKVFRSTGRVEWGMCSKRLRLFLAIVIIFFGLGSNLLEIKKEVRAFLAARGPANQSRYVGVFDELRDSLPRSGEVGYVSGPGSGKVWSDPDATWDFFQAGYALCPLMIIPNRMTPYVIVNCHDSGGGACSLDSRYALVKELKSNARPNLIRLYRKTEQ